MLILIESFISNKGFVNDFCELKRLKSLFGFRPCDFESLGSFLGKKGFSSLKELSIVRIVSFVSFGDSFEMSESSLSSLFDSKLEFSVIDWLKKI